MVTIARDKKGCVYVRRSTSDQEDSLLTQIDWALKKSKSCGVELSASEADLAVAIAHSYPHYKSMFIDDGVSGTDRTRKGLSELRSYLKEDKTITHLFVQRADRLGRDDALYITDLESEIRRLGITIVYNDKEKEPLGRDGPGLADVITSIIDHDHSRQWLEIHSGRIVDSQIRGAKQGYSMGGSPPYGFKRVLVGPDGKIIETIKPGRRVKENGCHVEIVPGDEKELNVLRTIFDLSKQGLGAKSIANKLNEMEIPSPAAGRKRKDNNTEHRVTGLWNHTSVASLIRNRKLVGLLDFGKRSEGIVRRYSIDGPRKLEDTDYSPSTKLKTVYNEGSQIISVPGKYPPPINEEVFEQANNQLDSRGKSQRGIPKNLDPSKNLLACRVMDLHNGCGHPMYPKGIADSRYYACGRYMKTNGKQCNHNKINADQLEEVSIAGVRQLVLNRMERSDFEKMIKDEATKQHSRDKNEKDLENAKRNVESIERSITRVKSRLAKEADEELHAEYRKEYDTLQANLKQSKMELERITLEQNTPSLAEGKIEKCMMLFDRPHLLFSKPQSRKRLMDFFSQIGIRIGIEFETRVKGKDRMVQVPTKGMMKLNNEELPVPLYGKDNVEHVV